MITDSKELIRIMNENGFMINPFGDKYYSFKIVINNCKEKTYYFIESKDAFEKEDLK